MRFFLSVLSILPENGGFIRRGGTLFFRFFRAALRFLWETDGVLPFSPLLRHAKAKKSPKTLYF